jgi:glycosyltransferase involved in cell wall biosynthesis
MTEPLPIRVALLTTSVEFGGIEQVVLNLLDHMEPGVQLYPVVFTRTDTADSIFFEELRARRVVHEALIVNNVRPVYVANPLVNLRQALAIFRRERFDLVHCHGYRANMFGVMLAKSCGIPAVATCHGYIPNDRKLRFYRALDGHLLRRFTRVVAVSPAMKDELVSDRGVDAARIDVIPNAVAEVSPSERERRRRDMRARLQVRDGGFVFGYVGRLSPEKGVEHFLAAARLLAGRGVRARYLVVGDGPDRPRLEGLASEMPTSEVTFAGFQRDTDSWFAAMDAFVLPSLTEGTPVALLQAMAHGLPAIASNVGGVPAVIAHLDTGLLVPPGEPDRLADAMARVLEQPETGRGLATRARESIARRYGTQEWIARTVGVYRSVTGRPSSSMFRNGQIGPRTTSVSETNPL